MQGLWGQNERFNTLRVCETLGTGENILFEMLKIFYLKLLQNYMRTNLMVSLLQCLGKCSFNFFVDKCTNTPDRGVAIDVPSNCPEGL